MYQEEWCIAQIFSASMKRNERLFRRDPMIKLPERRL
jgi:hypothetical protein